MNNKGTVQIVKFEYFSNLFVTKMMLFSSIKCSSSAHALSSMHRKLNVFVTSGYNFLVDTHKQRLVTCFFLIRQQVLKCKDNIADISEKYFDLVDKQLRLVLIKGDINVKPIYRFLLLQLLRQACGEGISIKRHHKDQTLSTLGGR